MKNIRVVVIIHSKLPLTTCVHSALIAISGEIMQIHYSKHHQTYVNNLNAALEKLGEATAKNDISAQIGMATFWDGLET